MHFKDYLLYQSGRTQTKNGKDKVIYEKDFKVFHSVTYANQTDLPTETVIYVN